MMTADMRTEIHLHLAQEPDEHEGQMLLDRDFRQSHDSMTQLLNTMQSLVCMLFTCISLMSCYLLRRPSFYTDELTSLQHLKVQSPKRLLGHSEQPSASRKTPSRLVMSCYSRPLRGP